MKQFHCIDCWMCEEHKDGLGLCNVEEFPVPVRLSDPACEYVELTGSKDREPQELPDPTGMLKEITGTWLHKPHFTCYWYVNRDGYPAECVSDFREAEPHKVYPSLSDVHFPGVEKALDKLSKAVTE